MYRWESSIDGGSWLSFFEDSNKVPVRGITQSEMYRCIASNEAGGTISNTSTVTLMGKSMSLSTLVWNLFSYVFTEIITQPTSPLTVVALEDAILTCLSSVDDASYSWHRVGGSVPSRSIGQNNNTLTIPRATPDDVGMYYCIAKRKDIIVQSDKAVVSVNGRDCIGH